MATEADKDTQHDTPIRHISDVALEYTLVDILGTGISGNVYKAVRLSDNKVVALKMISRKVSPKELQEEFEIVKRLNEGAPEKNGLVRYYDMFSSASVDSHCFAYYIAMQYLPGSDLFNTLVDLNNSGKRIASSSLLKIMKKILKVVEYIHSRKAAHLDIKPENIRVSDGKYYFIDFGFSAMEGIKLGGCRGSFAYAPPELRLGRTYANSLSLEEYQKVDVWCLGMCFLELAAGDSSANFWKQRGPFLLDVERAVEHQKNCHCSPETYPLIGHSIDYPEFPRHVLERALYGVEAPVSNFIKSMLVVNYKLRPCASDLLKELKKI